jgi:hypothetical protein
MQKASRGIEHGASDVRRHGLDVRCRVVVARVNERGLDICCMARKFIVDGRRSGGVVDRRMIESSSWLV